MKIETKQKLNLPELIQHVIDNGWNSYQVTSDNGVDVYFSYGNRFVICDNGSISLDDTFTVEVEEVITLTTKFDELTEYIYDDSDNHHFTAKHKGTNISMIIDCETHQFKTQAIYCKDTLIWSKEHGIPESGVLEVDADVQ